MDRPGLIVAPLTPFTPALELDVPALRRQIDYVVEHCGATMVVAAGVETQEYTYLSLEARKALVRATIEKLGISSKKDVGTLMKTLMAEHKGKIDGKLVQKVAGELLDS